MSNKIIPIFIPHYGCPRDCVFCNQNKISGSSGDIDPKHIIQSIEEYLGFFKDKNNIDLAFYGGSFTAIDIETQTMLLEIANDYIKSGKIKEIRISTRPDGIDEEILNFLKKYNVKTIELGVQSLIDEVLIASNRGHGTDDVYRSAYLIKEFNFKLGLQQMIGLPKDSLEYALYTAREFVSLKPDLVRIYPTLIIKDTDLEKLYYSGNYQPLTLEEAVEWSKELLKVYYKKDINVIRVGLQPTESIQKGHDVVAGPFHPSFRQLAEDSLVKDLLVRRLEEDRDFYKDKNLLIMASSKTLNNISGQKALNKKFFIDHFSLKGLKLQSGDYSNSKVLIATDEKIVEIDLI